MAEGWRKLAVVPVACVVLAAASWMSPARADDGPGILEGEADTAHQTPAAESGSPVTPDEPDTPQGEPQSSSQSTEATYQIQVGDTVSVTVLGEPGYCGSYLVQPDGTVLFGDETLGAVQVGGFTVQGATEALTAELGEYVKDPTVILAVARFKAMIVGKVRTPGQYEIASGTRLVDAIGLAGGPAGQDRDLEHVYVKKVSGEEVRFNLRDFIAKGDPLQNPVVEAGDAVSVGISPSSRCGEFEVAGAVNSPGRFRLYEGDETRVSEAIQQAGRWTEDANPKSARLIRKDGSDHTIDLTQLDSDPGSAGDLLLADGDELFVPRCTAQIHVLGAVRKPGEYRVAEGTTLLEAIAIAGGPTETAVLRGCAVVRSYPERERVCADLDRLLHDGDVTQNPVLRNRDVIFLPARSPAPQSKGGVLETVAGFAGQVLRYLWIFR